MKLTKSLVKKGGKKSLKKTLKMKKSKKGGKKSLNTKKARKTHKMKIKMKGGGKEVELIIPPLGNADKYKDKNKIEMPLDEYEKEHLINQAEEKMTYGEVVMYILNNDREGKATNLYFERPQEEESAKVIRFINITETVEFNDENDIAELPDNIKDHLRKAILEAKNAPYFFHKDFEEIYNEMIKQGMNAYGTFRKPEEAPAEEAPVEEGEAAPEAPAEEGETNGGKKKSRKTRKSRKMKGGELTMEDPPKEGECIKKGITGLHTYKVVEVTPSNGFGPPTVVATDSSGKPYRFRLVDMVRCVAR